MNNKTTLFLFLFFSIYVLCGIFVDSASSTQLNVDYKEMEDYLRKAKIVSVTPDENAGRTEPWIIELDDGKIQRKAYFKHVRRSRPRPLPDCYTYELAAYELSKLLGIKCVPPSVEREINGIRGSLQLWVGERESLQNVIEKNLKLSDPEKFNQSMLDCRVFENLVYCSPSDEDVLVDIERSTVCRVDFSEAFQPEHRLMGEIEMTKCSDSLYRNLRHLRDEDVRKQLASYLNGEEMEALLARKKLIIAELSNKKSNTFRPGAEE